MNLEISVEDIYLPDLLPAHLLLEYIDLQRFIWNILRIRLNQVSLESNSLRKELEVMQQGILSYASSILISLYVISLYVYILYLIALYLISLYPISIYLISYIFISYIFLSYIFISYTLYLYFISYIFISYIFISHIFIRYISYLIIYILYRII